MSRYKKIPKVSPSEYEVSEDLSIQKYKLTEESRVFRNKIVDFVTKQAIQDKKVVGV
jgi:hypothetical protein